MVAYLEAALEEAGDDPKFITHTLGVAARALGIRLRAEAAAGADCK